MQTYTFTESELRRLLGDALQLFSLQPEVYDYSKGGARQFVIDEIIGALDHAIPYAGEPLPTEDTGNA